MIRIITSLVAVLTVTSIQSQTTLKDTPKLVIGITIDQLRADYLDLFQHTFSERGFKRLLNEGLVYQNMTFDFPDLNSASSIATIYTGVNPSHHGIVYSKRFLPDKNSDVSIFEDNSFLGNYTKEKLSPLALRAGTITDELKIASKGKSDIYSFAPNSFQALISAGHDANGAYWIEDFSGKWATSTYFKDFDWSVEQENRSNIYPNRINTLVWQPLLSPDQYNLFPYGSEDISFNNKFVLADNSFRLFKESPFVNENITKTATALITKAEMGKRSRPDFLALTYYAGNFSASNDGEYSYEIQDTYARLDRELATLLDQVEKSVGLQNTLIFVTSTGYYSSNVIDKDNLQSSAGIFYTNRCEALLNMYLVAIYGKEQWVEKYYNQQIYLNRKLIESKNISLEEIQNKAAEFIVQFTGVQDATTSIQLLTGKASSNMLPYSNILDKDISGDILIQIRSGYQIIDEQNASSIKKIERETAVVSPVIFFGFNIKAEKIKRTIKATEIAPTVCRILRIRSPNGSKEQSLPEFL